MNVIKNSIYVAALTAISQSAMAASFAYEARSLGMGNIGVATADIAAAPFANPAMLSYQREDDDFSLLLSVGGFFSDSEGLIDDIDQFQASINDNEKLTLVQQMDGKVISPEVSGAIAIGFAGETYSMAVSARTDVVVVGCLQNVSTSLLTINDPAFNLLTIDGARTTEVGFSVARNFDIMESKISIGVTPKIVSVEAVGYSESVVTAGTDMGNLVDNSVQDLGDFTTVDVGVVMELTDHVQIGATAKNLITEEISFQGGILSFDTELKVGVAYRGDILTAGVDLDLTENQAAFFGLKRKNLSMGLEVDVFDYLQLRAGMIKNMADGIPDSAKESVTTVGVGLWLGFNLDIAITSGEGDSMGAFAQAGFKF